MPNLFIPYLLSSQPCEESFRQMRSMGTMNYTKINFTLLELFNLVGRIELQNDIMYSKLSNSNVIFPRNKTFNISQCRYKLPSDDEIKLAMQKAEGNAVNDALMLGMSIENDHILSSTLTTTDIKSTDNCNGFCDDQCVCDEIDGHEITPVIECSSLQDFSDEVFDMEKSSNFVRVTCSDDGKSKLIRKTHYLWLLNDSKDGLSNDRLKRVQSQDKKKTSCKQLQFKRAHRPKGIIECDQIQIGDWCIFHDRGHHIDNNMGDKFLFGSVLSFQYVGNNFKEKKYTWDFAFVKPADSNKNPRGINALALWHTINENGTIQKIKNNKCFYINMDDYICTVSEPLFCRIEDGICFEDSFFEHIKEDLSKLKCKRTK